MPYVEQQFQISRIPILMTKTEDLNAHGSTLAIGTKSLQKVTVKRVDGVFGGIDDLIGINFVLESYYAMMSDEAHREKIAPTRDKDDQRKAELVALTGAAIPVDQAMAQLAKGARPETITPQASEDVAPMTGWSKLPKLTAQSKRAKPSAT